MASEAESKTKVQETENKDAVPSPTVAPSESRTEFVEISFDEESAGLRYAALWKQVIFYGLPLLSFAIFVFIVVGTVVPNITKIFATIDEINGLREKDEKLDKRIEDLEKLRASNQERQAIIDKINSIIPTGKSEVVTFSERVVSTVTDQGLILDSAKAGEDFLTERSTELTEGEGLTLIEIPSEFSMKGIFNGFRNMLTALYDGQDFFVVDLMNLRLSPTDENLENWVANLNLAKYQFFVEEDFDVDTYYKSVSERAQPDPTVIKFLESRFLPTEEDENVEITSEVLE